MKKVLLFIFSAVLSIEYETEELTSFLGTKTSKSCLIFSYYIL